MHLEQNQTRQTEIVFSYLSNYVLMYQIITNLHVLLPTN